MTRRTISFFILALVAMAALVTPAPTAFADDPLQPGDYVGTTVGGCTLSFVFKGTGAYVGKTYFSLAAHCVEHVGDLVEDINGVQFAKVALIGDANNNNDDYAFVEVLPTQLARVVAWVKGHPDYPRSLATVGTTAIGKKVAISGYGLGFDTTTTTQEKRVGVLTYHDANEYDLVAPIIYGDSGGPIVYKQTGGALGIVSRLCIDICSEMGPTIQGVLAKATARGFTVRLVTIYG